MKLTCFEPYEFMTIVRGYVAEGALRDSHDPFQKPESSYSSHFHSTTFSTTGRQRRR